MVLDNRQNTYIASIVVMVANFFSDAVSTCFDYMLRNSQTLVAIIKNTQEWM